MEAIASMVKGQFQKPLTTTEIEEREAKHREWQREEARRDFVHCPTMEQMCYQARLPVIYDNSQHSDFGDGKTKFMIRPKKKGQPWKQAPYPPPSNKLGMFLTGQAGRGKGHYASIVFKQWFMWANWINSETRPRWIHVDAVWLPTCDFVMQMREASNFNTQGSEAKIMDGYCKTRALVLDDLGAESMTDYSFKIIYQLLETRIRTGMTTIVTSNLSLNQIKTRDPRLASRLGGMAYYRLDGPDRRLDGRDGCYRKNASNEKDFGDEDGNARR